MPTIDAALRRRLVSARVAYLATARGGQPTVVPISFVFLGNRIYHAIDSKPKRVPPERLRRVRNLEANPRAAVLIEHYEEDWTKLWFTLLEGRARLLRSGPEHRRAIQALRRKYPQYLEMPLDPGALVVSVEVERTRFWTFGSNPAPSGAGSRRRSRGTTVRRST